MTGDSSAVRTAVFSALARALGLAPASPEASRRILRAYADPPPPVPPPTADVLYYDLFPDPSAAPRPEETTVSANRAEIFHFIPYILQLVFYGLHAEADANAVRARLYLDGPGRPRRILREAGIYPVPRPPEIAVLHEAEDFRHRKRADLTVRLRIADVQTVSGIETVSSAPAIIKYY